MRKMGQADAQAEGEVWPVPRLLRLPEVQKHKKDRVRDDLVDGFLDYLRAERDASPLTLRNYGADLAAFRTWFVEKTKTQCDWIHVDSFHLRGYLVYLSERRYDRPTI